jgi:hypothetical protein
MLPSPPLTVPDVQISRFRFFKGELRSQQCTEWAISRRDKRNKRPLRCTYAANALALCCGLERIVPVCAPAGSASAESGKKGGRAK